MAALTLGSVALPNDASACRIRQFPVDARADADAAVVVELTLVTPRDDNSFWAKAAAKRLAFGASTRDTFEFGNFSAGASCGPLPQTGDPWVVYLTREGITAFYPLGNALALDPRIAGAVAEPGAE